MEKITSRRKLRPLKLGKRSTGFYVFDTETGIIDKHGNIEYILSARPEHLIFGVVYGKDYCKVLHSADEFKKEFTHRRYKNKIIYAHNAEYDLSAVYGNIYLMDGNAVFNGKFICATNENAKFADSFNLMPTSVKKLGELLGMPKGTLGSNLKSHLDNLDNDIAYCKRDCEIVYKSLERLFEGLEPSYTVGSHAIKTFRHKYMKDEILVDGLADKFFECMYGGRTEAFRIGPCDAKVYDINSAYPYAMKKPLPDPSRIFETDRMSYLFDPNYGGMITATVRINKFERLPALPLKWEGKLLFPTGVISGSWTFPEIRHALKFTQTEILNVDKILVSPLIESPFIDFIDALYAKRSATTDEFLRYRYKLEMNNVYGKLVQRLRDEYKFFRTEAEVYAYMRKQKTPRAELTKVVGGYFIRYDVDKIYPHTIPCWGAYITAYVRVQLHEMMLKFFPDLVYCDTDSVFLARDLNINEKQLGGWKKENKIITNIRTLKDYVYVDEAGETARMLKGVKKDAQQLTQDADVWKYNRMIKTRESMRRIDCRPPGTFIEQIKLLTGDYNKRIVLPDGSTKPFNF